jgi:CYTH domain-containing protein
MKEIERKFLPKYLPDLSGYPHSILERHFLYSANGIELRIQTNGSWYKLQRKVSVSQTERDTEEIMLSKEEFEVLKERAVTSISRESYRVSDSPKTDIKVYHGPFEGLVRVEIECDSQEDLAHVALPEWVGVEITNSSLARDARLLTLTHAEFLAELEKYKGQS